MLWPFSELSSRAGKYAHDHCVESKVLDGESITKISCKHLISFGKHFFLRKKGKILCFSGNLEDASKILNNILPTFAILAGASRSVEKSHLHSLRKHFFAAPPGGWVQMGGNRGWKPHLSWSRGASPAPWNHSVLYGWESSTHFSSCVSSGSHQITV